MELQNYFLQLQRSFHESSGFPIIEKLLNPYDMPGTLLSSGNEKKSHNFYSCSIQMKEIEDREEYTFSEDYNMEL